MIGKKGENKIHVYNTYRPSIVFWENLHKFAPDRFLFVSMKKKYREDTNFQDLPGSQFKGSYTKRVITFVYGIKAAFEVFFSGKKNRLFLTHPPLFFLLGLVFKKIRGDKYIVHVMDVFPEIIFESIRWTRYFRFIFYKLAIKGLNGAEKIVVIGHCMEELLIQKGVKQSKIVYFPNFSGINIVERGQVKNLNSLHIVYAGNIGYGHDLSTLLSLA